MTHRSSLPWLLFAGAFAFLSGCSVQPGTLTQPNSSAGPAPTVAGVANQVNGVAPNREIAVAFSEDMDPSTINAQTFSISGVAATVSYDASSRIASLKPNNDLQPNTQYSATVTTGVASSAGVHMAQNYTFAFTTRASQDTSPPQVMSTTPANRATCVDVTSRITVIFSEGLDPATINSSSFFISGVQGTVTYDSMNLVATLTPSAPLQQNTTYTGTLTASIADLAGVALAAPVTFSFTTGPCGGGVGGGANTFLYVGIPTTPALRGYQVNASAASLTEVPGSPFPYAGAKSPGALIVNKDFAYVTSTDETTDSSGAPVPSGTSTIRVYRADASGTLTPVQSLTVPTTQAALYLEPTGHNIYDIDVSSNIYTLTINADGTLTNTGSKVTPPGPLESLAFSPNGQLAYASVVTGTVSGCDKGPCPTNDATWEVNRDSASGALTFSRQVGTNQHLFDMQINASGNYLLAMSTSPNQISVYSINSSTGDLTPVPGSQFPIPRSLTESGDNLRTFAIDPSGNFVYALSFGGANFDREYVTVFSLNQTTGVLAPVQTYDISTPGNPTSLVVDQSLVYVVNWPVNLQPTGPFIPSRIYPLQRDATTGMVSAGGSPVVMQDQEGLQGAALMHFQ